MALSRVQQVGQHGMATCVEITLDLPPVEVGAGLSTDAVRGFHHAYSSNWSHASLVILARIDVPLLAVEFEATMRCPGRCAVVSLHIAQGTPLAAVSL